MTARQIEKEQKADPLKGAIAGFIGGLVASWVMNQAQAGMSKLIEGMEKSHGAQSLKLSGGQQGVEKEREQPEQDDEDQEDATEKVAEAIAENIFDRRLSKDEKEEAGAVVHYAFGTGMGAFYGVAVEATPEISYGYGLPFGVVFWLAADEVMVPLLGLAKPPTEYPLSTHAYALAAHLVYGATAEAVRRVVRKLI